jgi:hypothetical protein
MPIGIGGEVWRSDNGFFDILFCVSVGNLYPEVRGNDMASALAADCKRGGCSALPFFRG